MAGMSSVAAVASEHALLSAENTALKATVAQLEALVEKLKYQLAQLNRRHFGTSAEGLAQLGLWSPAEIPAPELSSLPSTPVPAHERTKPVRRPLPDTLPRRVIELDLSAEQQACPCCGGARQLIGEELSEKLDIEPARMTVLQYRRRKYACRACAGQVQSAPLPAQLIEQGLATPGLLAQVAVAKFCDHTPLARQERFYARHGIELARSTLTDWMLATGVAVEPLVERMGEWVRREEILASDDTPLPWQNGRAGKTSTARLWVWHARVGGQKPLLVYHFTADRSGQYPAQFLATWRGYLQVDAYAAYDRLFAEGQIIEVGCMAHCRRRYFEIAKSASTPGFAHEIVQRIGALYAIEREAKARELDAPARQALRQEQATPLAAALRARVEAYLPGLPPKGPLAQAIGYTVRHWRALTRYLEDGRLEIDNNAVERAIRPVAQGRANWLFVASERGGRAAAALYSLIQSASANGHNPYAYLRDVLSRLPATKARDIDSLLPHLWQPQS